MTGIDGNKAEALDRDALVATLKKFGRYVEPVGY